MIKNSISELFHYFQNLHVMLWITTNSDLPTAQLLVIYNKISPINLLMNWYWLYILWVGSVSKVIVISFPKWTSMNSPYCIKCKNQFKKSNSLIPPGFKLCWWHQIKNSTHQLGLERGWFSLLTNMLWIE